MKAMRSIRPSSLLG